MKNKIIIVLVVVIIFGCFFYFMDRKRESEIEQINENFQYTKGIVMKKTVYKGRHIRVKYVVNNKEYIESAGFDEGDNIIVGDSISIKYSINNPNLMITEFNNNY